MSATTLESTPEDRATLRLKMEAEIANIVANSTKLGAETAKLTTETAKLAAEMRTYPWLPLMTAVIGSTGLIGSIVALIIAFHR